MCLIAPFSVESITESVKVKAVQSITQIVNVTYDDTVRGRLQVGSMLVKSIMRRGGKVDVD